MTGYPVWIGTASWRLGSRGGAQYGTASRITAPGQVAETVLCDHRHRKSRVARECGERMAAERNAKEATR